MKHRVMAASIVAIFLSFLAYGTGAFFTAEEQAHNIITTNGIDIELEEWQETEDGIVPYPQDEPVRVMPGVTVSKIVTIKNLEAEAYIRARYEVVIADSEGNIMPISREELADIITVTVNEEAWLRKTDDVEWWYYASGVMPGETTDAFFTEVILDGPNMTNEYQNCTIQVNVSAQAVQIANNGSDVFNAAGWPADEGGE